MSARIIMKLKVVDVRDAGDRVRLLTLKHPLRPTLPPPSPGAHVDVRLPDGRIRHYSLCGDPDDATQYIIAVKHESEGRGGSRWIHENIGTGATLHVSAPRNHFALAAEADRHILIAGGIGITPMMAMAWHLMREGRPFEIHFCARSAAAAPLLQEMKERFSGHLHCYFSGDPAGRRFNPASALSNAGDGTHVYCCGPSRLVDSVRQATAAWPGGRVHVEKFAPISQNTPPAPFAVSIASSGQTFNVPADRSALAVLRENGFQISSSCEIGVCGSCECGYLSGRVIHRDAVLDLDQQKSKLLLCVSRAEAGLVLDL